MLSSSVLVLRGAGRYVARSVPVVADIRVPRGVDGLSPTDYIHTSLLPSNCLTGQTAISHTLLLDGLVCDPPFSAERQTFNGHNVRDERVGARRDLPFHGLSRSENDRRVVWWCDLYWSGEHKNGEGPESRHRLIHDSSVGAFTQERLVGVCGRCEAVNDPRREPIYCLVELCLAYRDEL